MYCNADNDSNDINGMESSFASAYKVTNHELNLKSDVSKRAVKENSQRL